MPTDVGADRGVDLGAALGAFARTKIRPPRLRAGLQPRPALEATLRSALGELPLVLLQAPAGGGKTALVARVLAGLPADAALAWVSLDEGDDLPMVATALIAALEPLDLPWRRSPEAALLATQDGERASRQALATLVLHTLAASERPLGLIVLDDLHRSDDPALHAWLDALVERMPPGWTLLVTARHDPPLALGRWRAAGALLELRQAALGFSPDEVRALLAQRLGPDGAGDADALTARAARLHQRTQGWPAGLGLALAGRESGDGGDDGRGGGDLADAALDRHAFDYLTAEVLDALPPALRRFLLDCSVLAEWTPRACQAVCGDPDAGRWLDEVERRGLFVTPLQGDEAALKPHDLFREALDRSLSRESPARLPLLLRRAADIETDPVRRLGHRLRAGDWDAAEADVAALAPTLLTDGAIATLLRLLGSFPPERQAASPRLQLALALAGWARWDWPAMRAAAEAATAGFAAAGDAPQRLRALSYACVAWSAVDDDERTEAGLAELLRHPLDDDTRARALLVESIVAYTRGDHPGVVAPWQQLVAILERCDRLPMWYEATPQPGYAGLPGMRPVLERYIAGVQRALPEQPVPLSGMVQVTRGWLQLYALDGEGLDATLAAVEADSRWLGRPTNLHWQLQMLHGMACALRGDGPGVRATAWRIADEAAAFGAQGRPNPYFGRLVYYAARLSAIAGDEAGLAWQLRRAESQRDRPDWQLPPHYAEHLEALAQSARGDSAAALAAWRRVLAHGAVADVYAVLAEATLHVAALEQQAGDIAAAASRLVALALRLDEGDDGAALMAGPVVLARLADADWVVADRTCALPSAVRDRLRGWARAARDWRGDRPAAAPSVLTLAPPTGPASATALAAGPSSTPAATDPAATTLSPRELEVLERLAAGDSNKLIARAFDLSPHTVKRHVANILDKLGLDSRGQAAAWWRAHRSGTG